MFIKSRMSLAVVAAMTSTLTLGSVHAAESDDANLEEVVVTGIAASLSRSIDKKRNSDLVADSITAEDLGKFPDNNIADSLQRIPGVAIDRAGGEGRFVSIRGLGPDFSAVLINGRSPASENEERAFSFDTLASELVRTVDVFKTSNPGLKEGGLGGTINIVTARPFDFDGFHAAGSIKGMYEENSEDTSPQASFVVSNTFNDEKFGVLASVTYQERSSAKYTVENEHISKTTEEPFLTFTNPSQGWGGGYAYSGDGLEEDTYRIQSLYAGVTNETRERIGGNLVLQLQATDDLVLTADIIHSKYDSSTSKYSTGSYMWAPTLSPLNQVDKNGFYNVINHGYDAGYNITGYAHLLTTTERPTESNVGGLNAAWDISDEWKMIADISMSDAILDNRGLDRLYIVEFLDRPGYLMTSNGGIPTLEYADPAAIKPEMGSANMKDLRARINSNDGIYNKANNHEFKLDFEWTPVDSFLSQVKFGANNTVAEKSTEYWATPDLIRRMYHGLATQQVMDTDSIIKGVLKQGDVFGGLNGDVYMIDPVAYRNWMAENIDGRTRANTPAGIASKEAFIANGNSWDAVKSNDSYTIEEDVTSFYLEAAGETEIFTMPLHLSGGVRYTETELTSSGTSQVLIGLEREAAEPGRPPSPWLVQQFADEAGTAIALNNDYDNWLPSLNARLEVTDDFYVRAAVSETLTRPTLTALAPYTSYGTTTTSTRMARGNNPNLKPFVSQNLDLSFEYYYGDANLVAVALYKKEIDDFIVTMSLPETFENIAVEDPEWRTFMVTRPHNGESATIEGVEINWTHIFENGFGFATNYTFVNSSASLSAANATETFALPGISDTGNATVFYDKDGVEVRVAYNYRTPFLGRVFNGPSNEPVHYDAYGAFDVSASYDVTDRITVFVEGSNVTGETVNKYGRYKNQFIGFEDTGALYTFGLRAKL
ncbi:TonB-dependent receptor [Cellvibrio sp. pealriver]|uniref:TonB-dependent receptor n=1 Tax=Cellvibrio sp. pealriver TaxID=1622269 RepID=UPI00066FF990|nr:TonB-dependent receptor [Cellvibrio sp. pealriver]